MKMDTRKAMLATAMFGLVMANGAIAAENGSETDANMVKCYGVNACKGQGSCAGASHSCAGKNACKGQGAVKTTAEDCKAKGGKQG